MASTGKKNKTKWTPMPVEATTKKKVMSCWADEVDKEMEKTPSAFKPDSVVLPTAPRASRSSNYDESKIPSSPPYQVYLSNIPYDLTDEELADHFSELKIKGVSLPKEDRGGGSRARGFAYVILEDRQSLIAALNKNDLVIKGRNINIELATNDNRTGGMNRGGRRDGGRNELGSSQVDRTSNNWRAGPRSEDIDRSSNFDRGFSGRKEFSSSGFRTNFDREDRGFHNRDERNFDNRNFGRDRDDRRDGFFQDRDRDRGGFNREREFDRERHFSRARDDDDRFRRDDRANSQWRDEPRSFNRHDDRRDKERDRDFGRDRSDRFNSRRDDPPVVSSAPSGGVQKTRPTLKLLPKSENAASNANGPTPSQQAIFGGAKPVDTAAREREIEDRLMKSTDDVNGTRPRGPSSIGSGSGKDGRDIKEGEPDKKRIEPAPLPKENPWGKSRQSQQPSEVVNNGRTSPDESRNNSTSQDDRGDSNKSFARPRHEPRKEDSKWNKGPPPNRPVANNTEKSKAARDDRNAGKHKEPKKDLDDISRMPKVQETAVPSFAGSNKFSTLDTEEAPAE